MMDAPTCAKVAVREISFRHKRLHRFVMECIITLKIDKMNVEKQLRKGIAKSPTDP